MSLLESLALAVGNICNPGTGTASLQWKRTTRSRWGMTVAAQAAVLDLPRTEFPWVDSESCSCGGDGKEFSLISVKRKTGIAVF